MQLQLTETDQKVLDAGKADDDAVYQSKKQKHKKFSIIAIIIGVVLVAGIVLLLFFTTTHRSDDDRAFIIVLFTAASVLAAIAILALIIGAGTPFRYSDSLDAAKRKIIEDRFEFTFADESILSKGVYGTLRKFLVEKNDEIFEVMIAFTDTHIRVLPVKTYKETVDNL